MVKILELFLVSVFLIIIEIYCSKLIGNILSEYYESETVKAFKEEWVKYKKPFENAIMTNIKENYGAKSINIYMKRARDTLKITRGFYLSDNIVHVIFSDMILRDRPNLIMPEVSLSLPGNLLKVETTVGKMFVDTVYRMVRNESAVLYSEDELDKYSPFSLQQVQSTGKLTIIAEDCFLSGFSIVTFLGNSVALGHSTFRLVDCKFTVEISSDVGTPPVIAPYFPKGPGKQIESLLSRPIRDELVQNLQGAMYSYINTSVIFDNALPKYKINQQKLFKQTSNYLTSLCDKLNSLTLEAQKGSIELSDFEDQMETKTDEKRSITYLSLKELKLHGLDTAYASRTGGSFEDSQLSIADSIRFHSLQVRGKAFYDNGTQYTHNFAVELADLAVNVIINIEKEGSNSVHKFEIVFGKTFGFSILPWDTGITERLWYQAVVSGYINNEVPARITEHLSGVLTPAANENEQDNLKLYDENYQFGEIMKKVRKPTDDEKTSAYADATDVTNEQADEKTVEEPSENPTDVISDSNTSAEPQENLSNKMQKGIVGVMVTAPEDLLKSDNSADEEPARGTDTVTAPNSNVQLSNDDIKVFSGLDSDFFSDGKGKKAFISDFENEQTDKQSLADKSDKVLESDFFSDNKGKNTFLSDMESDPKSKENLASDKTDDVLDKDFFSNDEGKKPFFSASNEEKHSLTSEDDAKMTNNKVKKHIIIFASSENDGDKLNTEMTNNENDKNQLNDNIAEQSDQQSVPIERIGKISHGIADDETIHRKRPTKQIHKRNKKELNNLKLTLRKNPRANTNKVQIQKITTQSVKHLQASKDHNKTRLLQNEVHMSDNEILGG